MSQETESTGLEEPVAETGQAQPEEQSTAGQAPSTDGAPAAEEHDVAALQAEVENLRQQVATQDNGKENKHLGRRWAVALLVLFGTILFFAANGVLWLRGVVLDTDDWVATVGPLTQNEVIVDAVSKYVVGGLFEVIDAQTLVQEVLPEELTFLSGPATLAVEGLVQDIVSTIVQSDEFTAVWTAVNRAGHQTILSVLRGDGNLAYMQEGQLVLDLSDVFDFIQQTLALDGLENIVGDDWGKFVLLENSQVAALQQVLSVLDAIGLLLPIAAIALFVIAWAISLWRRKTVLWIGVSIVITMILSLLLLAVAKPLVLASIVEPIVRVVAGELWTVVFRLYIIQTFILMIIGFLIAVGAALAGPHPRAVAFRTGAGERWNNLRKK
jgi:hypothetical protein